MGLFGTAATVIVPDFNNVLHHYPLTIGEYALGIDYTGRPNALAREYQMTVGQLVGQFGVKNCSTMVVNAYDRNSLDTMIPVIHLVEERIGRDAAKKDAKNMQFASTYIEAGTADDKVLSESGFKSLRVLAPRWAVTGNDTYGSSPGMDALGDVKQLQHQQQRKSQGIDYQVNPPLQVPTTYKGAPQARLPGGLMYVDSPGSTAAVRSAFDVQLNLQHLLLDIQDVRERIRTAYYADLFLMLANDTRSGVTATEVAERHEEKLLMLGPVLERLQNELLQPLIDITFEMCRDAGILPPAPPVLEGNELLVEFISTLAQAQRVVSAQGTDRLLGTITNLAGVRPDVLDKIDFDQAVDDYGDMYGVNPKLVLPTAVANQVRAQRMKAQKMAQMAAAAPAVASAADAVKTAGDTNSAGLRDVMNMFQGYGSPSAQEV